MKIKVNGKGGPLGFLFGFVFIAIAIGMLWWNEGRTVENQKAIGEVKDTYIEVNSDTIDNNNEGKLIVTNGNIIINDEKPLKDDDFNVEVKTIKLYRLVEMYQYEEECDEDSDGYETCSYNRVWSDNLIDSSNFENNKYVNPTSKKIESQAYYANDVDLGKYNLPKELYEDVSLKGEYAELKQEVADSKSLYLKGNYYTSYEEKPEIGDIRISFVYNNSEEGTVLAVQENDSFKEYISKNDIVFFRLFEGRLTGSEVVNTLVKENNLIKWLIRFMGLLFIVVGINTLLSPLTWLANKMPLFGNLINYVTGFVSFLLSLVITCIVIAIAWLRFRPVVAGVLIIVVLILILLMIKLPKKNKKEITE